MIAFSNQFQRPHLFFSYVYNDIKRSLNTQAQETTYTFIHKKRAALEKATQENLNKCKFILIYEL